MANTVRGVITIAIGLGLLPVVTGLVADAVADPNTDAATAALLGLFGLIFAAGLIYSALRDFGVVGQKGL